MRRLTPLNTQVCHFPFLYRALLQSSGCSSSSAIPSVTTHRFSFYLVSSRASSSTTTKKGTTATTPGKVHVTFLQRDGVEKACSASIGDSLMEVARQNKIDIEAACDGTCSCSTCHVYIDPENYAKIPPPSEDEMDMLDLAVGMEEGSSRLACQVKITGDMERLIAILPEETSNQMKET